MKTPSSTFVNLKNSHSLAIFTRSILGLGLLLGVVGFSGAQQYGSEQVSTALNQGIGSFLAVSFTGGLLALLTPCVFPMVPVTVSFFSKRTRLPMISALLYALGIIMTFAVLGVGASAIFGAAGVSRFAANPWVNLALAGLFIVLALNLFGLYEFQLGFASKISQNASEKKDSMLSPAIMGMAFSLTSFTCTGPIVAGLLLLAAKSGSLVYPAIGMTSFGLAFSLPFFLLALFPAAISKVPRSGAWLGAVKPALGFIELAAAVKFLSNADLVWQLGLLTRPIFAAIWGLLAVGLGIYLLGRNRATFAKTGLVRRGLGVLSFVGAVLLFVLPGGGRLGGLDAYLPPNPYPQKTTTSNAPEVPTGSIKTLSVYKDAIAQAKSTGKNVFVDFTGVTCTNCRWMEENVFPDATVHNYLSQLVNVQLYTDRGTPEDNSNQDLEQKLGKTIALPLYLVVTPDGKLLGKSEGKVSTAEFQNFLAASVKKA